MGVGTLDVKDASILTDGIRNQGGRIMIVAKDLVHLHDAEMVSTGPKAAAGTSVITLAAPLFAMGNNSRVESRTSEGQLLTGISAVSLLSDVTVISADSSIRGLVPESEAIDAQLVAPEGVFLNVANLLRESCAAWRSEGLSSFTAMGRGGLPPDPAGPLPGSYLVQGRVAAAGKTGPVVAFGFGEGCGAAPGG